MSALPDALAQDARFGIPGRLSVRQLPDNPPLVDMVCEHGQAVLSLDGGQLLSWTPTDQPPVVWLSPAAVWKPGKSFRGGVPVCWPWFGAHPDASDLPNHGFARNLPWEITDSATTEDGGVQVTLALMPDEAAAARWPHQATLTLMVELERALTLRLITRNTGDSPLPLTEALHTYLHVGDAAQVALTGLEGLTYADKEADFARKTQNGPVTLDAPTDRVYFAAPETCTVEDPVLGRRVRVAKQGGATFVVWNPWIPGAKAIGDMPDDGYTQMLCVEAANALDDAITVAPGSEHTLATTLSWEAL